MNPYKIILLVFFLAYTPSNYSKTTVSQKPQAVVSRKQMILDWSFSIDFQADVPLESGNTVKLMQATCRPVDLDNVPKDHVTKVINRAILDYLSLIADKVGIDFVESDFDKSLDKQIKECVQESIKAQKNRAVYTKIIPMCGLYQVTFDALVVHQDPTGKRRYVVIVVTKKGTLCPNYTIASSQAHGMTFKNSIYPVIQQLEEAINRSREKEANSGKLTIIAQ